MQTNEESVAICVGFAPLKNNQIMTVIFHVTPYFVMKNIEIKIFEMAKPMKIKISKRATHARNELMLLQNISARV